MKTKRNAAAAAAARMRKEGKRERKKKGKGGGNKKIRACVIEALYPTKEKKKEKWSNCAKLTCYLP